MARTRRASRKRTSKKRTSARRTSTRRKPVRRTRRSTTARTRAKGTRVTRKTQKKILIVAVAVAALLLLMYLLQNTSFVQNRWFGGEVGRNAVYGKVTSAAIGLAGRGTIHVQSFNTGKIYTFYTGVRTDYNIRGRYPYVGEKVKVSYVNDQGYLKATYISIR
jgi:uncharacterized integral membrane protein